MRREDLIFIKENKKTIDLEKAENFLSKLQHFLESTTNDDLTEDTNIENVENCESVIEMNLIIPPEREDSNLVLPELIDNDCDTESDSSSDFSDSDEDIEKKNMKQKKEN